MTLKVFNEKYQILPKMFAYDHKLLFLRSNISENFILLTFYVKPYLVLDLFSCVTLLQEFHKFHHLPYESSVELYWEFALKHAKHVNELRFVDFRS